MENPAQSENYEPKQQGVIPGCWKGMFFSMDIHHSLLLRKMLGEKRNSSDRRVGGTKVSEITVDSITGGYQSNHSRTKVKPVEEGANIGGKTSDKKLMRRLNPLEIYKKYGILKQKIQKLKVDPSPRRFSRTISIHHLECNDYVPLDQIKAEESNRYLHGQKRFDVLGHQLQENQALLREKLKETRNKLLERQFSERYSQFGEYLRPGLQIKRSSSYPGPSRSLLSSLNHEESRRDGRGTVHQFKDLKQRRKDVLKENTRISLDGALHKIPHGSTPSGELTRGEFSLLEGSDGRGNFDGNILRNFAPGNSGRVARSKSLKESLERYEQLLESNMKKEPMRGKSSKTFGRISSLPNFESYYPYEDNQKEIPRSFFHSRSISLDHGQERAVCDESDKSMVENITNSFYDATESDNQEKPRSVSKEFSSPQGSEMKSDDSEEQQSTADESLSNANGLKVPGTHLNFDAFRAKVDVKHEAQFLHLVDVLEKYWSSSNGLYEMNLSLGPKSDGPISGNLDQELINDLTDEVLLEILESSCGLVSMKPMIHILKHAWVNISWHLDNQQEADDGLENIIERDFKRNQGWMRLGRDVEDVGIDLEVMLLDDLMDELLTDFLLNSG